MATRLSAEVNQAVDVLKDPVRRANYMLELAGGPSAAEVHDVPGDLLMEVMTLREQIEEAQAQSDAEALDRIRTTVTAKHTDAMSQIAARVDHLATSDTDAKQEVRRLLNSIRYFDNLLAELVSDPLAAQPDKKDA
jgi:molecular chaperone HscB